MTNIPQFALQLATTPRLKRKHFATNTTVLTDNKAFVEAEGDRTRYIGSLAKVKRGVYQWEAWSFARGLGDKRTFKVVATGRSKTLLAALSRVRYEFGQYHARKDAAKETAAA